MDVKITFYYILMLSVVTALLTASIFLMPAATYAQTLTEGDNTGTTLSTTTPPEGTSPLTFTLKMGDSGGGVTSNTAIPPSTDTSTVPSPSSSPTTTPSSPTQSDTTEATATTTSAATSNNLSTRNIGIDVTVLRGNEAPIILPINTTIPANVNNLDLCASAMTVGAVEMCQPVLRTIDLTQNGAATTDTTASGTTSSSPLSSPSSPSSSSSAPTTAAPTTSSSFPPATTGGGNSLIGSSIEDTAVNIPITVIAPITAQIQNARLCAQLPSGTQSCNQIILNPQQTSYTPVNVDMTTSPAPTVTLSQVTDTTTATGTTTTGTTDTGGGGATSSSSSTTTTTPTTPSTPPPTTTTPPPTSTNNNTTNTTGGATSSLPAPGGRDTISPTLAVPNDMTLQTNGPTALLAYSVTAQDDRDGTATLDEDNQLIQGDNVGGNIFISCRPQSQYFLPVDSRLVQCFAADAVNNTAQASFIVTVRNTTSPAGPTDTIAPSLSVPVTRVIPTTSPTGQERVLYDVSATDNIDGTARLDANNILIQEDNFAGSVAISRNPSSNTNFPLGNHTVQCRAIDAAGNRGTASFIVAVTSATANTPPGGTSSGGVGGITISGLDMSSGLDIQFITPSGSYVNSNTYNGSCPVAMNVYTTITDSIGNRDITFRHIFNDYSGPEVVRHFDQPESQTANYAISAIGDNEDEPSVQGWVAVEILQPVQFQSNRAEFQITCTPPSTGGAAQAQTLQAENTTTATDDEDTPAITDEGEAGDGGDDGTDSGTPPPATTDEGEAGEGGEGTEPPPDTTDEGEAGEGGETEEEEEAVGGAEVAE
jgi:hypothetical protein